MKTEIYIKELHEQARNVIEDGKLLLNVHRELANPESIVNSPVNLVKKDFLDLVILYRVIIRSDEKETVSFKVTYELLSKLNITIEELDKAAVRNDRLVYKCAGMFETLYKLTGNASFNSGDESMKILSNKSGQYGASAITDPELLSILSTEWGDDLYIFPSSVHECIAVPASMTEDIDYLRAMVRTVNMNEVEESERLSDSVYYYDRAEKRVRVA